MNPRSIRICQTRILLVHELAGQSTACIASLTVRAIPRNGWPNGENLIAYVGNVQPDAPGLEHQNRVASVGVSILDGLGQQPCSFEASVSSMGAAAALGHQTVLGGRSADVALVLAMVGAGGGPMPVDGLVATGGIDPSSGNVEMVGFLDCKLDAAGQAGDVVRYVMPRAARDGSIAILTPEYDDRIVRSRAAWVRSLDIIEVGDVAELFPAATDDWNLVGAAQEGGYYFPVLPAQPTSAQDPISRTVTFLREGNPARFRSLLESLLRDGDSQRTAELLSADAAVHVDAGRYADGRGAMLRGFLRSVPATVRRRLRYPLLPYGQAMALAALATTSEQHRDALMMLEAVNGQHLEAVRPRPSTGPATSGHSAADAAANLAWVCDQISHETLSRLFDRPLDEAREGFGPDLQVPSHEAYLDGIAAFYAHLGQHTGLVPVWQDAGLNQADGLKLVAEALADQGGADVAEAIARRGEGLRPVVERTLEYLKQKLKAMHVTGVIKESWDPLDGPAQLDFVRALMARLGDQLPADVRAQPPEFFVNRLEVLVRRYVQGRDRVIETFRGF